MKIKTIKNQRGATLPRFLPKALVLILAILTIANDSLAQQKPQSNQSISIMPSIIFDDITPLGKSIDVMYERRLWEKLYVKGGVHLSNIQKIAGGRSSDFRFQPGVNVDDYLAYFRSQGIRTEESFTQNMQLAELSINYRFGKRNEFIPELGIKVGSGYKASLDVNASTVARFQRNPLFGIMVGFNYAIKLKNGFYLQPSVRFYSLADPKFHKTGSISGFSFGGRSFGVAVRKDLSSKTKK
ncbi:MAG: hypothetical protein K2X48_02065 [Chitinophagaceae bacterium]|nr:hypothetical protein [Chitinophagaceae bacterium]